MSLEARPAKVVRIFISDDARKIYEEVLRGYLPPQRFADHMEISRQSAINLILNLVKQDIQEGRIIIDNKQA